MKFSDSKKTLNSTLTAFKIKQGIICNGQRLEQSTDDRSRSHTKYN